MGLSSVSRRGKRGGKSLDVNQLRELLSKTPMVTALGVVRKFPGESSHFEVNTENGSNEILVDVELMPSGTRVQCRLGFGNDGVYRIPRVDCEVAVLLPYDSSSLIKDSMDFEPIIVGVLDTSAHSALDGDDIIVMEADRVKIFAEDVVVEADSVVVEADSVEVKAGDIKLGTLINPLDGVVVGTGVDCFTGATYAVLGSASTVVKAKK